VKIEILFMLATEYYLAKAKVDKEVKSETSLLLDFPALNLYRCSWAAAIISGACLHPHLQRAWLI